MNSEHFPGEFEIPLSAFKGHPIERAGIVQPELVEPLERLFIRDAEQLVAVHSVEEARPELAALLGISGRDLERIVDEARRAVAPRVAADLDTPDEPDRGLGALEPTPAMMAEALTIPLMAAGGPAVALPEAMILAKLMPPIRNQAARGTCVAFALTALHEFHRKVQVGQPELSEQHLYYETKLIDGAPNGCGTWQVKAVQALRERGQCRETVWPYNPNEPCNNHGTEPSGARPDGLNQRLTTWPINPKDVLAIKTALAGGSPVTFSIPVYNSWYRSPETRRTGRITMRIGTEPAAGGHAMCLIGYQDDPSAPGGGYFILRNSWGTGWAAESPYGSGNGTIPYAYLGNDNWEAMAAESLGPTDERLVEVRHDIRPEFLAWNGEAFIRLTSFEITNLAGPRPIRLDRLRLRSWEEQRVIDEVIVELQPGGAESIEGGARAIRLSGVRLRAVGTRFSWRYRLTWDFLHSETAAFGEGASAPAPEGSVEASGSGGGDADREGSGDDSPSGRRTLTIDTGGNVDIVIR